MEIYKKLFKNSFIFAIANLGSKLISIILVPFYTYVLNTNEYGTIDLITTTISLAIPLITLSIFEATLRFSVKSNYSKTSIFSSSVIIFVTCNFVFLIMYPFTKMIDFMNNYIFLFYMILFSQGTSTLLSYFLRGIGKIKIFALNGVINTAIIVVLNILLLVKYKMGIEGYLISIVVSNIFCCIFMIISAKVWKYFRIYGFNKKLIHEMLIYSIPLIPNALMWWIMNLSDRYAVTAFLGVAANGLYAVANKIPNLLNIVNSIFFQAWQLSAIEESDTDSKSEFYTNVFNIFSICMILSSSGILVLLKPIIKLFISNDFYASWKYVPFLLLSVVFSSFASFLGTNYIAMKETKGIFKSSLVGAIINIILNVIFIKLIGLNGASIATMISFFIVWIMRSFDTRKFVVIKIKIKRFIIMIGIIFIQILIMYINIKNELIVQLVLLGLLLIINSRELLLFCRRLIRN